MKKGIIKGILFFIICNLLLINYVYGESTNNDSGVDGIYEWITIGKIRNPSSGFSQDFINRFSQFNTQDKYYLNNINHEEKIVENQNGYSYYYLNNIWDPNPFAMANLRISGNVTSTSTYSMNVNGKVTNGYRCWNGEVTGDNCIIGGNCNVRLPGKWTNCNSSTSTTSTTSTTGTSTTTNSSNPFSGLSSTNNSTSGTSTTNSSNPFSGLSFTNNSTSGTSTTNSSNPFSGLSFTNNSTSGTIINLTDEQYTRETTILGKLTSLEYNSLEECNTKKEGYDLTDTNYIRSVCFKYKNNYKYFICRNNESCDISNYLNPTSTSTTNSSNPFSGLSSTNNSTSGTSTSGTSTSGTSTSGTSVNLRYPIRSDGYVHNGNQCWVGEVNCPDNNTGTLCSLGTNGRWIVCPSLNSSGTSTTNNSNPFALISSSTNTNNQIDSSIRNGQDGNDYWWTIGLIRDPISNNSQDFINDFQMFNNNDRYYVTIINGDKSNQRVIKENGDVYMKGANYWILGETGTDSSGNWFTIGFIRNTQSNSPDFINLFTQFNIKDKFYVTMENGVPKSPRVLTTNGDLYYKSNNGWVRQNTNSSTTTNSSNPFAGVSSSTNTNNSSNTTNSSNPFALISSSSNTTNQVDSSIRNGQDGNDYWWTIGLIRDPISNNSQDFINDFQMFNNNDRYYVTIINGDKSNQRVIKENGDVYMKGANYWILGETGTDSSGNWFTIGFIRNTQSNSPDFINLFTQFNIKDKFYVTMENGVPKSPRVLTTNGDLYYKSNNSWVRQNPNNNEQNQAILNNTNNRDNTTFGILYTTLHCPGIINNGLGIRYTEGDDLVYNNPNWPQAIYHWGKPQLGHYCLNGSEGEGVLRKHAEWLIDAGIDYILLDATNHPYMDERSHSTNEMIIEPAKKLLQVWSTIPNAPKVVIFVPVIQGGDVYNVLLQELNKYPNMKFIYKGKPLLLNATDDERYITDTNAVQTLSETMTIRDMWALNGVGTKWQYMNKTGEQGPNNGEEISVNPAYQLSYMTSSDAVGKNNGETFKSQFSSVFANPGIDTVVISAWNSWGSIRLQNRFDPTKAAYTDSYNEDKNPDIEPQDGGKGDFYYQLMKKCISSYKQGRNSCE